MKPSLSPPLRTRNASAARILNTPELAPDAWTTCSEPVNRASSPNPLLSNFLPASSRKKQIDILAKPQLLHGYQKSPLLFQQHNPKTRHRGNRHPVGPADQDHDHATPDAKTDAHQNFLLQYRPCLQQGRCVQL